MSPIGAFITFGGLLLLFYLDTEKINIDGELYDYEEPVIRYSKNASVEKFLKNYKISKKYTFDDYMNHELLSEECKKRINYYYSLEKDVKYQDQDLNLYFSDLFPVVLDFIHNSGKKDELMKKLNRTMVESNCNKVSSKIIELMYVINNEHPDVKIITPLFKFYN